MNSKNFQGLKTCINNLDLVSQNSNELLAQIQNPNETDLINDIISKAEQTQNILNQIVQIQQKMENKNMGLIKENSELEKVKKDIEFLKFNLERYKKSGNNEGRVARIEKNLKELKAKKTELEADKSLEEDVEMTIDQILQKPDDVKKLSDKKVDVKAIAESTILSLKKKGLLKEDANAIYTAAIGAGVPAATLIGAFIIELKKYMKNNPGVKTTDAIKAVGKSLGNGADSIRKNVG